MLKRGLLIGSMIILLAGCARHEYHSNIPHGTAFKHCLEIKHQLHTGGHLKPLYKRLTATKRAELMKESHYWGCNIPNKDFDTSNVVIHYNKGRS